MYGFSRSPELCLPDLGIVIIFNTVGDFKQYLKILLLMPISYSSLYEISTKAWQILYFSYKFILTWYSLDTSHFFIKKEKTHAFHFLYQDILSWQVGNYELLCLK